VMTLALPPGMNSVEMGRRMQEAGFLLSCNSEYLRRQNWIQICLIGEIPREKVTALANALRRIGQKYLRKETVVSQSEAKA